MSRQSRTKQTNRGPWQAFMILIPKLRYTCTSIFSLPVCLHDGLICIVCCPSVCLLLDQNSDETNIILVKVSLKPMLLTKLHYIVLEDLFRQVWSRSSNTILYQLCTVDNIRACKAPQIKKYIYSM